MDYKFRVKRVKALGSLLDVDRLKVTCLLVEDVLDEELDADEINDILEGRNDCLLQSKRTFRHNTISGSLLDINYSGMTFDSDDDAIDDDSDASESSEDHDTDDETDLEDYEICGLVHDSMDAILTRRISNIGDTVYGMCFICFIQVLIL
jgi:deoxycytidylate deaminase